MSERRHIISVGIDVASPQNIQEHNHSNSGKHLRQVTRSLLEITRDIHIIPSAITFWQVYLSENGTPNSQALRSPN